MLFSDYNFKDFINEGIEKLGFKKPTQCQSLVIGKILKRKNVICTSQTGTGKTHAFLLPLLESIEFDNHQIQKIILVPTRELAQQIYKNIQFFANINKQLKVSCFTGGKDIERQINNINNLNPQIIVGTPTRIRNIYDSKKVILTNANQIIIDECDMIFDLGFIEDLELLMSKMRKDINTSVFSATIDHSMKNFLNKYLNQPIIVNTSKDSLVNKNIEHRLIHTKHQERKIILKKILNTFDPYLCLIFINNKKNIDEYYHMLLELNLSVVRLHGGLQPRERKQVLKRIKNLEYKYVICSDLASRGIDIEGVSHVISIDLPNNLEYYIHRSGRTGRGDYNGISFVLYDTNNQDLVNLLKVKNIDFKYYQIHENSLKIIDKKKNNFKKDIKKNKTNIEVNKIIKRYKINNSGKNVKPGYRKKMKSEVKKVTKQIKRENIRKSIRDQKKREKEKS
ncbi:DEAD/DEAH box helicase [Spiroplasma endosymbiont of Amphibalanus improvisus]|uniref:DEAD/DEAH box helicase n=1 Tax=Spiroplasma endosymbiont of Amphibalanus improvisus TaxID=3066327 RepID=UPI00313CC1A8